LKLRYVGMSVVVLRDNNLEIKLGLFYWLNIHSNHLQMTKCYPIQKRDNIPTQSTHKSWNHYFVNFWGSFTIWGSGATSVHLPHGFTSTNKCPTKYIDGRCLGYVEFECHAIFFMLIENHLHIGINKKNMFNICCP